jgi:hypothetical protein
MVEFFFTDIMEDSKMRNLEIRMGYEPMSSINMWLKPEEIKDLYLKVAELIIDVKPTETK